LEEAGLLVAVFARASRRERWASLERVSDHGQGVTGLALRVSVSVSVSVSMSVSGWQQSVP